MKNKEIYILGVGNNTEVYIDFVESCGYNPTGLFHYNDERTGTKLHGITIVDSNTNLFKNNTLSKMQFAISVGNNEIRSDLTHQILKRGGIIPTLIHPSAVVSKYALIGKGVAIHANSVVQAGATIDEGTIISYNGSVSHTTSIGKYCYLAFCSSIGAFVKIADHVLVGQAAVVISGKVDYIGEYSIVGAGSVVTKSIEPHTVVAGNPARVIAKS